MPNKNATKATKDNSLPAHWQVCSVLMSIIVLYQLIEGSTESCSHREEELYEIKFVTKENLFHDGKWYKFPKETSTENDRGKLSKSVEHLVVDRMWQKWCVGWKVNWIP
ncbi:unnamed protein product [Albugo candida]|uniref:Uncharacterized protein n=1 Tax=Albugo candida TaxID=65357 RepID=A0A024GKQ7_9STRA|nr:unnamed protein product [Albugo candida]|eukprot:CCI47319.1 unnamed protein product [Albugo candida]